MKSLIVFSFFVAFWKLLESSEKNQNFYIHRDNEIIFTESNKRSEIPNDCDGKVYLHDEVLICLYRSTDIDQEGLLFTNVSTGIILKKINIGLTNLTIGEINYEDGIILFLDSDGKSIFALEYTLQNTKISSIIKLYSSEECVIVRMIHAVEECKNEIFIRSIDYFGRISSNLYMGQNYVINFFKWDLGFLYWTNGENCLVSYRIDTKEFKDYNITVRSYDIYNGSIVYKTMSDTKAWYIAVNVSNFIQESIFVPTLKYYSSSQQIENPFFHRKGTFASRTRSELDSSDCLPFILNTNEIEKFKCPQISICVPKRVQFLYEESSYACRNYERTHGEMEEFKFLLTNRKISILNDPKKILVREQDVMSIQIDPLEKFIYWNNGSIFRTSFDQNKYGSTELVLRYKNPVKEFQLDYHSRNLYWSSGNLWISPLAHTPFEASQNNAITIVSLMNGPFNERQTQDNNGLLTIDVENRYLFYVQCEKVLDNKKVISSIIASWLDGTNKRVIYETFGRIWSLTTLPRDKLIFFLETSSYSSHDGRSSISATLNLGYTKKSLRVVSYTDSPNEALGYFKKFAKVKATEFEQIDRVKIEGDHLLMFNHNERIVRSYNILTKLLIDKSEINMASDQLLLNEYIVDITTYRGSDSHQNSKSPCSSNDETKKRQSVCSHFCFALPGLENLHYCGCPYGRSLDENRRNCEASSLAVIYSVKNFGLRRVYLSQTNQVLNHYNRFRDWHNNNSAIKFKVNKLMKELYAAALSVPNILDSRISIETFFHSSMPISSAFQHISKEKYSINIKILDIHLLEERLYWVDARHSNCISRIFLNNTMENIVICLSESQEKIISLSVDWEMNNLYYIVEFKGTRIYQQVEKVSTRLEVLDLKYLDSIGSWYQLHRNKRLSNIFQKNEGKRRSIDSIMLSEEYLSNADKHRMILYQSHDLPKDYNLRQVIVHQETKQLFLLKNSPAMNSSTIFKCELDSCQLPNREILWKGKGSVETFSIDHMRSHLSWNLGNILFVYDFDRRSLETIELLVYGLQVHHKDPTMTIFDNTESLNITKRNPKELRFTQVNFINSAVYLMDDSSAFLYRFDLSHLKKKDNNEEGSNKYSIGEPILTSGCISSKSLLSLFVTHKERKQRLLLTTRNHAAKFSAFTVQRSIDAFISRMNNNGPHTFSSYPIEIASLCVNKEFGLPLNICPGLCLGHRDRLANDLSISMVCHCPINQMIDQETFTCSEPRRMLRLLRADGSILNYNPDDENSMYFSSITRTTIEDIQFNRGVKLSTINLLPIMNKYSEAMVSESAFNTGAFVLVVLPYPDDDNETNDFDSDDVDQVKWRPKKSLPKNLLRLAHVRHSTGDISLYRGGPMIEYFEENEFQEIMNKLHQSKEISNQQHQQLTNDECSVNEPRKIEINWPNYKRKKFGNRNRWSLAFDPINHLLYWSDSKLATIRIEDESFNGKSERIQVDHQRRPLEVVVESRSGQIILLTGQYNGTDFVNLQIESLLLNGMDARVILSANELKNQAPHCLTYSNELKSLFWIDGTYGEIRSIQIFAHSKYPERDTTYQRVYVQGLTKRAENLLIFMGVSKTLIPGIPTGPIIIWKDQDSSKNEGFTLFYTPIKTSNLIMQPKRLMDQETFKNYFDFDSKSLTLILGMETDQVNDLSWHPCFSYDEKRCSHICQGEKSLNINLEPGPLDGRDVSNKKYLAYKCLCPMGYELSKTNYSIPEETCILKAMSKKNHHLNFCESPNLLCRGGLKKREFRPLPNFNSFPTRSLNTNMEWISEQEKEIKQQLLGLSRLIADLDYSRIFDTSDGVCLPTSWICDGVQDCQDNSDETGCQLCSGYQCNDGKCILQSARCDGIRDCDSDELCCSKEQFECQLPTWQSAYDRISQPSSINLAYSSFNRLADPQLDFNQRDARCISIVEMCNNKVDCQDGSDESDRNCLKNNLSQNMNMSTSDNLIIGPDKSNQIESSSLYNSLLRRFMDYLQYLRELDYPVMIYLLAAGLLILIIVILSICLHRKSKGNQEKTENFTETKLSVDFDVEGKLLADKTLEELPQKTVYQSSSSRVNCNCLELSDECLYHVRPCASSFHRHIPPVPPPSSFHSPPPSQSNRCPYRVGDSESDEYCGYLGTRAMQLIAPDNSHGIFGEDVDAIPRPKKRPIINRNESTGKKSVYIGRNKEDMKYSSQMSNSFHVQTNSCKYMAKTVTSNPNHRKYYDKVKIADVIFENRKLLQRKYEDNKSTTNGIHRLSQSRQAPYIPPHSHLMTSNSTRIHRRQDTPASRYFAITNDQGNNSISDEKTCQSSGNSSVISLEQKRVQAKRRRYRSNYLKMNEIKNLSDTQKKSASKERSYTARIKQRKSNYTRKKMKVDKNETDKSEGNCHLKENYQSDITNPPPSPSTELNYKLIASNQRKVEQRKNESVNQQSITRSGDRCLNDRSKIIVAGEPGRQHQQQLGVFNSVFKQDLDTPKESDDDFNRPIRPKYFDLNNSTIPPRESGEGRENPGSDMNLPQTSCTAINHDNVNFNVNQNARETTTGE